ncbi:MAG TPA: hypothetical protein VEW95_05520 [Candidatus Limnocylindrales bacterium]|nr:hypothetical protein [Candidatus Limnocylindrales bacterium]
MTTDLSEAEKEIRQLLGGARPAPWQWLDSEGSAAEDDYDELQDGHGEMVASGFSDDVVLDGSRLTTDGRLCAAMRNAMPAILERSDLWHRRVVELLSLLSDASKVQREPCNHIGIGRPGCLTCDPRVREALGVGSSESHRESHATAGPAASEGE